jgi:phosphoribosylaminoimidazole carboxylase PurE protein
MKACHETLDAFEVAHEVRVLSAHRSPEATATFAREAEDCGVQVLIAAAGMAAHLAGVLAAHSTLPVIGVPLASGALQGVDALLATVQMPPGIPVATVGIGAAGAKNAALLAVQILARGDGELSKKFAQHKAQLVEGVEQKNRKLQDELRG